MSNWLEGVRRECALARDKGILRDGTTDKFPLDRALIVCDNLNCLSGVPQDSARARTTKVGIGAHEWACYQELFEAGGQWWHAPVYVCANPVEVWGLHQSAEDAAVQLRMLATYHGWVVLEGRRHWEELSALRRTSGWHHKEEAYGTRWTKLWDMLLSSILRVREMVVFDLDAVTAVRARLPVGSR